MRSLFVQSARHARRSRKRARSHASALFTAATLLAVSVAASSAAAQDGGSLRGQTTPRAPTTLTGPGQIISINPFMPLLGWFQGEYERRLAANLSVAVAGSVLDFDNSRYANADVKLRLYPDELGLEGLGLAAGVGAGAINRKTASCDYDIISGSASGCRKKESGPSFSVEAHYQWLLGTTRATAVTLGGGVKRYFIDGKYDTGINRIMPTLRLTVGYAFK